MIHPSGIQPPKDLKLKIKPIKKGLYIVENAYVGDDAYFPDHTVEGIVNSTNDDEDKTEKVNDSKD